MRCVCSFDASGVACIICLPADIASAPDVCFRSTLAMNAHPLYVLPSFPVLGIFLPRLEFATVDRCLNRVVPPSLPHEAMPSFQTDRLSIARHVQASQHVATTHPSMRASGIRLTRVLVPPSVLRVHPTATVCLLWLSPSWEPPPGPITCLTTPSIPSRMLARPRTRKATIVRCFSSSPSAWLLFGAAHWLSNVLSH